LQETVDYHIKSTWHSIARMYNQIAIKYDISQATGFVLMNIDKEKGTPATKIAPLLGMEATSITRVLKNMETQGLIFRQKDESDGRMVRIFLTDLGMVKRKLARSVVKEFNEKVVESISERKLAIFFEVMEKINESVNHFKNAEQANYE